jgi:general secretion pathway protein A
MYIDFYGFTKPPFRTTPDADFLFLSPSHKEALASIIYGIEQKKGFIAITGEVGVGKTTILRSYLETVDKDKHKTIYIFNPSVTFESLLITILKELEVEPVSSQAAEMVNQLHELLIEAYRHGRVVVLVIDEAQNIPVQTLEGIRMLSNLETSTEKLIQIVLVGQPELETLLERHDLRQVRERIAVRTRILPLTKKESYAYIEHRLSHASSHKRDIFSKDALDLIVETAQGIPRKLNIHCDSALITGFGYQQPTISRKIAKEVIADFNGRDAVPFWKGKSALTFAAGFAGAVFIVFYLAFGTKISWVSVSVASPDVNQNEPLPKPKAAPDANGVTKSPETKSPETKGSETKGSETKGPETKGPETKGPEIVTEESAELSETARLLAVLLDSGRIVVGRVQPTINNPRLAEKGFSSAAFEAQLRKEFLTRTGHDLRHLAASAMPERTKPLLVRLAFFMQKAVHDAQPLINKKGIGFKGFIPATFGTQVAGDFTKDTGFKLRQIGPPGTPPRNPNNKPDEQEERALQAIQKSHPRVGDHSIEQQLPNSAVRVLLPLFYTKQCLGCHGTPKGQVDISGYEKEGAKEGDLGGAISITLPGNNKLSKGEQG